MMWQCKNKSDQSEEENLNFKKKLDPKKIAKKSQTKKESNMDKKTLRF